MDSDEGLLRKYLESKKDLFLNMRSKLGVGTEMGFGFSRSVCEPYDTGAVIFYFSHEGKIKMFGTDERGFVNSFEEITGEERSGWVISPQFNKNGSLLHIFPRKGPVEKAVLEERYLTAPDIVLCGLMAHEMAEYITKGGNYRFEEEVDRLFHSSSVSRHRGTSREAHYKGDILVCLFGLKDELLAHFDFRKDCLSGYEIPVKAEVGPIHMIQYYDERIAIVNNI